MKIYLRNLLIAIFGRNPYRMELDYVRNEYNQAAERIGQLEQKEEEYCAKLIADKKRIAGYQNLTENLRDRITEKDGELYVQRKSYHDELNKMRNDIRERDEKIAALKEDLDDTLERLQQSNHKIAHDCMAQQMLDKTMNAMDDLCTALNNGDREQILAMSENLNWCNPLLRIVQGMSGSIKRE